MKAGDKVRLNDGREGVVDQMYPIARLVSVRVPSTVPFFTTTLFVKRSEVTLIDPLGDIEEALL